MKFIKLLPCLLCFFFSNESNGSSEAIIPFQEKNPIISFFLNPMVKNDLRGLSQSEYTRLERYKETASSIAKAYYIWNFLEKEDVPDLQRCRTSIGEKFRLLKQVEESFDRILQTIDIRITDIDFFYREVEIFSEKRKIEFLEMQKARLILEKEITILGSESSMVQRDIIAKDIERRRIQELEEQKHKTALLKEREEQAKLVSAIELTTEVRPLQVEREKSKIAAERLEFEEDKAKKASSIAVIDSAVERSCEEKIATLETSIAAEREKQEQSRVNQKYSETKTILGGVKTGIETATTAVDSLAKSYATIRTPPDLYKAETERMDIDRKAKLESSLRETSGIIDSLEFLAGKVRITDIKKGLIQNIDKLKKLIETMKMI